MQCQCVSILKILLLLYYNFKIKKKKNALVNY